MKCIVHKSSTLWRDEYHSNKGLVTGRSESSCETGHTVVRLDCYRTGLSCLSVSVPTCPLSHPSSSHHGMVLLASRRCHVLDFPAPVPEPRKLLFFLSYPFSCRETEARRLRCILHMAGVLFLYF